LGSDKAWGPTRINTWTIALFLLYISGLPKSINHNPEIVLFVDDTSIIISSLNPIKFKNSVDKVVQDINKCCTAKLLSLM
jgi:hypothetical protein